MRRVESSFVLHFAPGGRNAEVLAAALDEGRIAHLACHDADEFGDQLQRRGHELGALVITERALAEGARDAIHAFQDNEPVWSELPVVLLTPHATGPGFFRPLRNVVLVPQPTDPNQFRSVIRLSLETRANQLDLQDLLMRLEEQRDLLQRAVQTARASGEIATSAGRGRDRALTASRRHLVRRREEDRLFLARELHDTVIQRLLYLSMQLSPGIRMAREAGQEELGQLVEEARTEAKRAVKDLRRLVRELRPAGLEIGLKAALEPTLLRLRNELDIEFEVDAAEELPADIALCLFRVAQEALRNIERHAAADRVRAAVRIRGGEVHLFVADDGRGFDVPDTLERFAQNDHFGLVGMEEFVMSLGGQLKIRSATGSGTCIRARIPLG